MANFDQPQRKRQTMWVCVFAVSALLILTGQAQPAFAQGQWATNGENINNTNARNVGVGTDSPASKLHVQGQAAVAGTGTVSSAGRTVTSSGDNFGDLRVGDVITAAGQYKTITAIDTAASPDTLTTNHSFNPPLPAGTAFTYRRSLVRLADGGGATQMIQTGAGNVGIGTAAPYNTLHLYKSAENLPTGISIDTAGTASVHQSELNLFTLGGGVQNVGTTTTKGWHLAARGNAFSDATRQNDLQLYSFNGSTFTSMQHWEYATGNVGVGTITPAHKLDVAGSVNGSGLCIAGDCRASWGQVGQWASSGSNISFSTGNVGVGTSAPASKLEVKGGSSDSSASALSIKNVSEANLLFVRNDGMVGVGTGAPASNFHVVSTVSGVDRGFMLDQISSDVLSSQFIFRKSRGTTASPTALVAGDVLGTLVFRGHDGAAYTTARARVRAATAENWSAAAQGAYLEFSTTPLGSTTIAERLRIDPAGNVGIGTTTPAEKLHVPARVRFGNILVGESRPSGVEASGETIESLGHLVLTSQSGYDIKFGNTGSQARMTITSAGNLGVGTTAPAYKLDVAGDVNSTGLCLGGDCKTAWSQVGGGMPSQWTTSGSNIHYTAGNVGVGTASPTAGLDVQNPVTSFSAYGVRLQQTLTAGGNNAGLTGLYINPTFVNGLAVDVRHNALVTGAGNIGFGTSATSAGLDVQNPGVFEPGPNTAIGTRFQQVLTPSNNTISTGLYINPIFNDGLAVGVRHNGLVVAAGDVGIGTSTPIAKLDVQGGKVNASDGLCIAGDCKTSWSQIGAGGPTTLGAVNVSSGQFGSATGGGNYSFPANVGIGTTSPTARLHVAGDGRLTGNLTVDGNISAKYQDVAEWVPSAQRLSAGTVVVLDTDRSNHVLASTRAYDTRVAGVVSAQPGVILGEGGEGKLMVATTGRVKVKVDATRAPVKVGDLLVTGVAEGVAMKSMPLDFGGTPIHRPGTIIGKALEPLEKGAGEILVLLSLQ